ncbi:MAG: sulfatase, partial [Verrucomicrobiae bacterium]|nr:sulfatase [Verrucomicrobiae bacterium]
MRWCLFTFLLAICLGLASAADRPNVVLIVADDLGWSDLACYGNGLHETPNLDGLASQGIRFTDYYAASPVCTPTRASILTGKHPARLHMTIWREAALERGKRKLLEPVCLDSLPLEETTLAEVLREAGYHTAHIGKWHLGRAEAYPQAHGFHENIGGTLWGAPQTFFYPFSGGQYFPDWRYVPDLEPGAPGEYLTDKLADAAIGVIERESRNGRPFFVNLWFHTVHTPIEGKPDLVKRYEAKIGPDSIRKNPHYAAMVHSLDENVGRVLAKLDELGIAGETIVAFTSDNGGFVNTCKLHPGLQVADNTPLRGGKGSCHEGGIRTPLIVRWPRTVKAGGESAHVSSFDNWMPTFADLTVT